MAGASRKGGLGPSSLGLYIRGNPVHPGMMMVLVVVVVMMMVVMMMVVVLMMKIIVNWTVSTEAAQRLAPMCSNT